MLEIEGKVRLIKNLSIVLIMHHGSWVIDVQRPVTD